MSLAISSRERLLATMSFQTTDRVPIVPRGIAPLEHNWSNAVERAEYLLALGCDDIVYLGVPWPYHPAVTVDTWREQGTAAYPIFYKRINTPAGTLQMAVRITEDWQVDDVPLFADQLWPRTVEPLVKSEADLEALDYVLYDPRKADLSHFRETAAYYKQQCRRLGVLFSGRMSTAGIHAMSFLGAKWMLFTIRDNPQLVRETLRRTQRWIRNGLELLLDIGVEAMYFSGCYETIDFWSPTDVRGFFLPLVAETVELCHQAGVKFHYFTETGSMPFLEDYARMGVDVFSALDGNGANATDPFETKRRIGDRVCLMGGVDPREAFERGSTEDVRRAVLQILQGMAPGGGYILSTTGSFQAQAKPENVMAFIKWGLQYGKYPLCLPEA